MICKKCGRKFDDDMPKCLWCDAPNHKYETPDAEPESTPEKPKASEPPAKSEKPKHSEKRHAIPTSTPPNLRTQNANRVPRYSG